MRPGGASRWRARVARQPRPPQPLPPPLPPETRTVGQLVAETISFYRHHFFQVIPLGLSVAALTQLTVAFGHRPRIPRGHPPARSLHDPTSILGGGIETTILLGALLLTAVVHRGDRPRHRGPCPTAAPRDGIRRRRARLPAGAAPGCRARAAGPAGRPVPGPVRLGRAGGSRRGCRPSGSRSGARCRLARADYIHAAGGLATIVIVFYVDAADARAADPRGRRGDRAFGSRSSPTWSSRRSCSSARRSSISTRRPG